MAFLKYILSLTVPNILKKIFDLGLSVELLFSEHFTYTFSQLFQPELSLRIRDIYFLLKFYSKINRHQDFSFFLLFECLVIATMLESHTELFLGMNKGCQFISCMKVVCLSISSIKDFLFRVFNNMSTLIEKQSLKVIKSVFHSLNDYL